LIAEFEGHIARLLGQITSGCFLPQPHPPSGHCLICCVDALGIDELAERARRFESTEAQP